MNHKGRQENESPTKKRRSRLAPGLDVRVFRDDCGSGRSGSCAIEALNDMVFTQRRVPKLVIRLPADRGFDIFSEWCVANGVPFRNYIRYARPDSLGRRKPLLPSRLSDFPRKPEPGRDSRGTISSWGASGWEELARLIHKGVAARSSADREPAKKALAGR